MKEKGAGNATSMGPRWRGAWQGLELTKFLSPCGSDSCPHLLLQKRTEEWPICLHASSAYLTKFRCNWQFCYTKYLHIYIYINSAFCTTFLPVLTHWQGTVWAPMGSRWRTGHSLVGQLPAWGAGLRSCVQLHPVLLMAGGLIMP